jgi:hypothetical protein
MSGINQDGHFLLTEAVIVNRLAKSIYRGGNLTQPPRLIFINQDGFPNAAASVNTLTEAVTL